MKILTWTLGMFALVAPSVAMSAETTTYQYDAQGRLVRVVHSGGPTSGVTVTYIIDQTENRTNVTLTGGQ